MCRRGKQIARPRKLIRDEVSVSGAWENPRCELLSQGYVRTGECLFRSVMQPVTFSRATRRREVTVNRPHRRTNKERSCSENERTSARDADLRENRRNCGFSNTISEDGVEIYFRKNTSPTQNSELICNERVRHAVEFPRDVPRTFVIKRI